MTIKTHHTFAIAAAALLAAQPAGAQTAPPTPARIAPPATGTKITLSNEITDFSGPFGKRRETTLESSFDLGRTTLVLSGSHATRKFEGESFKGLQLGAIAFHDWTDRFSSRTTVTLADKSPAFARTELAHDISYKLIPNALLTVGGKYARYDGNVDVKSLFAGGSLYFRGGFATYRLGVHDVDNRGHQFSHLASFRLKDPKGSGQSQLWLAAGTALQEQEVLAAGRKGKYRGFHLQRVQPIAGPVALSFGLGRTWYDTPASNYHGTKATVGITLTR